MKAAAFLGWHDTRLLKQVLGAILSKAISVLPFPGERQIERHRQDGPGARPPLGDQWHGTSPTPLDLPPTGITAADNSCFGCLPVLGDFLSTTVQVELVEEGHRWDL
jgi:hypothetical protein